MDDEINKKTKVPGEGDDDDEEDDDAGFVPEEIDDEDVPVVADKTEHEALLKKAHRQAIQRIHEIEKDKKREIANKKHDDDMLKMFEHTYDKYINRVRKIQDSQLDFDEKTLDQLLEQSI